MYFFFFKQKTAYEVRISDWSSDVCSSDLVVGQRIRRHRDDHAHLRTGNRSRHRPGAGAEQAPARNAAAPAGGAAARNARHQVDDQLSRGAGRLFRKRSEEHTSELQSLMRISYAVFCLKKKKKSTNASKIHLYSI